MNTSPSVLAPRAVRVRSMLCATAGLAVCVMAGCGGSRDSATISQLPAAGGTQSVQTERTVPSTATIAQHALPGVVAASTDDATSASVTPVNVIDLQAAMPDVAGWQRTQSAGDRVMSPFNFSQASASYAKGDARVVLKIMDSGLDQRLFSPFAAQMASGYQKTTPDGFEHAVTLSGNPGWETWDSGSRNGELGVLVARRYLVQVEGHGVADIRTLHDVLDRVNLTTLAALR